MQVIEYRVLLVDGKSGTSRAAAAYGRPMLVEHFPSHAAAMARLDERPRPDAVVIDQRLADGDPGTLTTRISSDPALDGTRVVMLAPDAEAYMAMPLLPSCDAYLVERDPEQGVTLALAAVTLFSR